MVHEIRCWMEKSRYLRDIVPKIQGLEVMQRRGYRLAKKDEIRAFKAVYRAHRGEFQRLSRMLEDDFSRKTLRAVIRFRMNRDRRVLKKVAVMPQYFQKSIFSPVEGEVFVDGGANIGDTIAGLFAFGGGRCYWKKVFAWEPDEINKRQLIEKCKNYENVEVVPFGLWSEKTELRFDMQGNTMSSVSDSGAQIISANTIDNICAGEKITFIKMDIEGSEQKALQGAERVIRRDRPRLGISIYHKPEDLFEIPLMVREMVPQYKLYIRHHYNGDSLNACETVLYAVAADD